MNIHRLFNETGTMEGILFNFYLEEEKQPIVNTYIDIVNFLLYLLSLLIVEIFLRRLLSKAFSLVIHLSLNTQVLYMCPLYVLLKQRKELGLM